MRALCPGIVAGENKVLRKGGPASRAAGRASKESRCCETFFCLHALEARPVTRRKTAVEMHQIHYFLAVCEEQNFSRAARRCGVSQPSVSNGIRALEHELGSPLFRRKPSITPTDLASAIRPLLQRITEQVASVRLVAHAAPLQPQPTSIPARHGAS